METSVPKRLDEVTLMRCVLALLIVFMHAFTCFNHSWQEPAGYVDVPLYKWLSRISFAFTLEAFVFISGYLYAYPGTVDEAMANGADKSNWVAGEYADVNVEYEMSTGGTTSSSAASRWRPRICWKTPAKSLQRKKST